MEPTLRANLAKTMINFYFCKTGKGNSRSTIFLTFQAQCLINYDAGYIAYLGQHEANIFVSFRNTSEKLANKNISKIHNFFMKLTLNLRL